MIGEIWTFKATKPSDNLEKVRPVLIVGDDAKKIGLDRKSVIKTTKLYTGSKMKLGSKIGELPFNKKEEFKQKYRNYQEDILSKW